VESQIQSLNQKIAERIGKDLVDLIPTDQWQKIVDHEVLKFKKETAPSIINELLREAYMVKAKETVDKLRLSTEWDEVAQEQINSELERFIGRASGTILAGMLSPAMQMVLQDLRGRLGY